jgi:integrase
VGETKNDDGRVISLTADLVAALQAQVARVDKLSKKLGRIIPDAFVHTANGPRSAKTRTLAYRAGDRIHGFRRAWRTACTKAGVPGALLHDFRRTAIRNMLNAGIPERVAMTVSGHKTRSVSDRYHIVSPEDLKAATAKLENGHSCRHSWVGRAVKPTTNPARNTRRARTS